MATWIGVGEKGRGRGSEKLRECLELWEGNKTVREDKLDYEMSKTFYVLNLGQGDPGDGGLWW